MVKNPSRSILIFLAVYCLGAVSLWLSPQMGLADLLDDVEEDSAKPDPGERRPSTLQNLDDGATKAPSPLPSGQLSPVKPSNERTAPKRSRQGSGKPGIVKFWSESASGDRSVLVLDENVVVTQDDIRLEADKATIYLEQGSKEVKEVHAVGSVKFSRKDPETGDPIRAEGREAVFNNKKRVVVMKGEPVLYRGKDVVRGKVIYYDLKNGWVKADRVEGVVQPAQSKAGEK